MSVFEEYFLHLTLNNEQTKYFILCTITTDCNLWGNPIVGLVAYIVLISFKEERRNLTCLFT